MRRICTGLLAAALALGLLAVEPAQAKVYKMDPEERTAALKEKKAKRAKAKKAGKAAPGQEQGGWVEMKPGEKVPKKNKKANVDELAKAAEKKGKKPAKAKKDASEAPEKKVKKTKETKKAGEEIVVEKKAKKAAATSKKTGKKAASKGDRLVGSNYGGEKKISGTSTEVRRPGVAAGDDLNSYSVSRPGLDKAPAVPEVRQEVQPGPLDTSKPVGTEPKGGEGRF